MPLVYDADAVKVGQLRTLLSEFEAKPLPVHVVYREGQ
jgi:hypothetical protein